MILQILFGITSFSKWCNLVSCHSNISNANWRKKFHRMILQYLLVIPVSFFDCNNPLFVAKHEIPVKMVKVMKWHLVTHERHYRPPNSRQNRTVNLNSIKYDVSIFNLNRNTILNSHHFSRLNDYHHPSSSSPPWHMITTTFSSSPPCHNRG